ncbi:MAG: hypothetical protein QNJ29_02950 [Rhizobiaceae bacterium]|nr:hypothetical protein [Rhizobiaceae bacterium]
MSIRNTQGAYKILSPSEFSREIEAGMRRAPEERAKAVKAFWGWLTRH